MIQVNNRGPVSMTSRFKPALRGLGALYYEKEGTSYVANDPTTMGVFKQLQRLVNAIFDKQLPPIIPGKLSVDGKLGAKTFSAVSQYVRAQPSVGPLAVPPPSSLLGLVEGIQNYVAALALSYDMVLPSASASVLSGDYQGSSYAPGGTTAPPPKPGITVTDNVGEAKKSGATVYVAGGLLALGAILLLGKFGSKVPKRRKGFRGCRGMACRGY